MKIESLEIENFGIFSGAKLQFAPGFQLIYGPNEAGKSTLLQLVRELLFGFPHRSRYSLDAGKIEAEAKITLRDGQRVTFRRRKGRGNTVTGKVDGTGTEVDDALLSRLLGNASDTLYEHVFGFSLKELASGEESLKTANLSEALYGGGLGSLTSFQKLREEIQTEHESLFKPSGSKPEINQILSELKQSRKSLKEAIVAPRDFKDAEKAGQLASDAVEQLRIERDEQQRRTAHSRRLLKALDPWLKLRRLREELAGSGSTVRISEQASEQHRAHLQRLDELSEEVTGLEGEHAQAVTALQAMTLQPDLLKAEPEIEALQQDVGRIRGFLADVPRLQQEARQKQLAVADELRRLQPDWSLDDLERFQVTRATEETLAELARESLQLAARQSTSETRFEEAQRSADELQDELSQLAEIPADPALAALVDQERAVLEQRKEATAAARQLATLDDQIQTRFARLNPQPGTQSLGEIESLRIPAEATLQEFRQRFSECDRAGEQARQNLKRDRDKLAERERDRSDLTQQSDVPSREELERQRRLRDADWRLIRRVLIDGRGVLDADDLRTAESDESRDPDSDRVRDDLDSDRVGDNSADVTDLPDRFEKRLEVADRLADERQSHAELVAKLDSLSLQIARVRDQVAESTAASSAAEQQREALLNDWHAVWSGCGVTPHSPEVMLEWRVEFSQIVSDLAESARLRRQIATEGASIVAFVASLSQRLDAAAQNTAAALPTDRQLEALLKAAQRLVQQSHETERDRQRLQRDLPVRTKQLDKLRMERDALAEQQQLHEQSRVALLQNLGFPLDWSLAVAERIVSGLGKARLELGHSRQLAEQAAECAAEGELFTANQRGLCQRLAVDLAELPAPDAVKRLSERLAAARRNQQSHVALSRDVQRLAEKIAALRKKRSEIDVRLTQSRESAGVATDDEFFTVAATSLRQQQIESEIVQQERSIALLRETEDASAFLAALEAADPDELAASNRRLSEEQSALVARYEAALEDRKSASDRLDALNRSNAATTEQQNIESGLAKLSDAVDRWAPLVLARTIMSRAIRNFEQKHQPAMFEDVSRLFSRMTGGRYVGLSHKLDESRTLLVEQSDGTRKSPEQLSTGTREQLYLAIRLAYVQHYCRDSEPLPLVMDDILVNFDAARARNTLEVLLELSNDLQILFLTCHDYMVDLIGKTRPGLNCLQL